MNIFGQRRRPPAWLFGLVGVAVIVGFAFATFQIWSNDNALAERGEQASARVVEVDQGRADRTRVEFSTAGGQQVQALIGQGDEGPDLKVGDELRIVYDPQDPTSDVRDVRAEDNHKFAYLTLGAAIVAAVAVPLVFLRLRRLERRDRTSKVD